MFSSAFSLMKLPDQEPIEPNHADRHLAPAAAFDASPASDRRTRMPRIVRKPRSRAGSCACTRSTGARRPQEGSPPCSDRNQSNSDNFPRADLPVNLQFRSEPSAVQRRAQIPSRRSRLGTRSKRRPPARGGPSTALCLPRRLGRYSASTLPEAAISSAIFPATLERTFGNRNSDATATRQRTAVPT